MLLTTFGLFLSLLGPAVAAPPAPVAASQVTPDSLPNPEVAEQCGLPVTLVLDASGSILSFDAVEQVRDAAEVFLDALKDTGATARVVDFGTVARQTAPADLVTTPSMQPTGVHGQALEHYYNPKPTVDPPDTYRYDGSGAVTDPGNFTLDHEDQWTNWQGALQVAGEVPSDLVVFVTDGDPTAASSSQPGDPFFDAGQDPPNARFNLAANLGALGYALSRGINAANALKQPSVGTRIVAVGVGAAVTQSNSLTRLTQIAGPQVVTEQNLGTITSINQIDVAVVQDFDDLASLLRRLVTELCSPSLTVRKFVQTADSTTPVPAPGWDITVEPTILGDPPGTYTWIQPAGAAVGPQTLVTNANGFAQFQWEPSPPDRASVATVSEDLASHPDYMTGPALCEVLEPDGDVFFYARISARFTIDVGPQDIVTCALQNNFVYEPAISLEKVASADVVRGDNGGTAVTYTYTVTNPGNTPLVLSGGDDPDCADIEPTGGDTDDDGRLDTTETWTFECTRTLQAGVPADQGEIFVENTASVAGVDPTGEVVRDTAEESVEVIVPIINLEKEVDQPLVELGGEVNYTFTVTNLGNDPLTEINLADDKCDPTFVGGDDGDGVLALDETWTYTCAAVILEDPTVNQAVVTGQPTIGDPVSDPAHAEVDIVYNDLQFTKSASAAQVFVGDSVTYTYAVTNPGETPLEPGTGLTRETMVVDNACSPVEFTGGDIDDDSIMQPLGVETWTYECTRTLDNSVLNIATTIMFDPLLEESQLRTDSELVLVVPAGIDIVKTASEDVVQAGTEVTYTYEVRNTAEAPLADVTTGVTDDFCSPVEFVEGDTDDDGLLDVGELFLFTCTATLTEDTTNTAEVTGTPLIGEDSGEPVSADDDATVDVFTPGIELVKTASDEVVRVDTPVTYTFVATNTGDISLTPLGITDDQCVPLEFIGGDPEGDQRMAPGEAWTWECTKTMLADTTNTAVIEAVDPTGGVVTADDDAEVAVFDSDIDLEKTADPILVPAGEITTFTLTVTNPGPVPLADITITDTVCTSVEFVSGDANGDDLLDPDETWTYTCSAPVDEVTVNVAEVEGTDPGGGKPTDTGVAGAIPYNPSLDVVKSVEPFQVQPGGSVTYTYAVTNTGDVPLAGVRGSISDNTCSPVSYVSGDVNDNGLLDADIDAPIFEFTSTVETWLFSCTTTVEEDTTNVVTVTGTPTDPDGNPIGPDVSADDEAVVEVIDELPATGIAPIWMAMAALLAALGALILVANRRRLRSQ